MINKIFLLLIILSFGVLECFANKIVIKTCPLMGERFVTQLPSPNRITEIFESELSNKGFEVISDYTNNQTFKDSNSIFSADIFVFQYPANYPTVKLVIRNKKEVIYFDEDFIKHFSDRQSVNEKIARKLAERIPDYENLANLENHYLNFSLEKNLFSIMGIASNSIIEMYVNKFRTELTFDSNTNVEFPYSISIEEYFKNLLNFVGYRRKVKGKKIILNLEIDEFGFTKIIESNMPVPLKEKFRNRIESTSLGIPLWHNPHNKKVSATLVFWTN